MFFHQCFLITLCTHHSRRSPWLQLPRWLSRSDVVVPSRPLPVDGRPHSRLLNSPHLIYVTFMSASILCHGCYLVHFCNKVIRERPHFLLKATFACTFDPLQCFTFLIFWDFVRNTWYDRLPQNALFCCNAKNLSHDKNLVSLTAFSTFSSHTYSYQSLKKHWPWNHILT